MPLVNSAKQDLLQRWVDNSTDIKMALLTSSHTTNIDSQQFFSDINSNEASGTGYTAGGQSVANVATNQDNTNDQGELTFDDVIWDATGGSLSAQYAVLYDDTGTASTSQILAIEDFGSEQTANDANFTVRDDDQDGGVTIS